MNRGIALTERITTDIEGFSEEKSQKKTRSLRQKEMLAFNEVIKGNLLTPHELLVYMILKRYAIFSDSNLTLTQVSLQTLDKALPLSIGDIKKAHRQLERKGVIYPVKQLHWTFAKQKYNMTILVNAPENWIYKSKTSQEQINLCYINLIDQIESYKSELIDTVSTEKLLQQLLKERN